MQEGGSEEDPLLRWFSSAADVHTGIVLQETETGMYRISLRDDLMNALYVDSRSFTDVRDILKEQGLKTVETQYSIPYFDK